MSITGQGQFTYEDLKEAIAAITKRQVRGATKFGGNRSWIGWVILLGLAVVFFMFMQRNGPPVRPTPPIVASPNTAQNVLQDVLLPMLPWVLIFGFIWFFVFRRLRTQRTSFWEKTPSMHRPRTWTIDDTGLTVSEPFAEHRTLWGGYVAFQETKNLFLLYTSEQIAEMIPKRVLGSEEQVEVARQIMQRNIGPPPGAFPVIVTSERT